MCVYSPTPCVKLHTSFCLENFQSIKVIIGNRLFQMLPGENPEGLKGILHFFCAVAIVPEASGKLKSSFIEMGYSVTHISVSSSPGCPCCPHTFGLLDQHSGMFFSLLCCCHRCATKSS